jgi:flagellar hook-associated protein FlgK
MKKFEDIVTINEAEFKPIQYETRLMDTFKVLHKWFDVINYVNDNTDNKTLRKKLIKLQDDLLKQFNTFNKKIEKEVKAEITKITNTK